MAKNEAGARLGATVDWKLFGTGPAIMQAFRKNELDLAYIGLPPAMIGIAHGIPVICIAGGHMEGTVMAGKSSWRDYSDANDIKTVLEQFRGAAIGVPGKGSIHDIILRNCLRTHGLGQDIEVKNFSWADLVTEAVVSNQVAAAFGTPALATAIKRFAGGRVLIPPSKLWPDNPSYGIIVSTAFLEREREAVTRFLTLHEEAAEYIRKQPVESAKLIAAHVGIVDKEFVLDTLLLSPRYCAQLSMDYIHAAMRFVPIMRELGYMERDIEESAVFYPNLIRAIIPGGDHYGVR